MKSGMADSIISRTESEERIIHAKPLEIYQNVQFRVDDDPLGRNDTGGVPDSLRNHKGTMSRTTVTAEA